jgi:hypothetical protein
MLHADDKGADLIVAVGTHHHPHRVPRQGRAGMPPLPHSHLLVAPSRWTPRASPALPSQDPTLHSSCSRRGAARPPRSPSGHALRPSAAGTLRGVVGTTSTTSCAATWAWPGGSDHLRTKPYRLPLPPVLAELVFPALASASPRPVPCREHRGHLTDQSTCCAPTVTTAQRHRGPDHGPGGPRGVESWTWASSRGGHLAGRDLALLACREPRTTTSPPSPTSSRRGCGEAARDSAHRGLDDPEPG